MIPNISLAIVMDSLRKDPELYKDMTDMLKRKFQSCSLNHHYLNNPIEDVTVSKTSSMRMKLLSHPRKLPILSFYNNPHVSNFGNVA